MGKGSNNFAFICKRFYIFIIFSEVGEYNNIQSNFTYSKKNFFKDDIYRNNEIYCQKFDLNPNLGGLFKGSLFGVKLSLV